MAHFEKLSFVAEVTFKDKIFNLFEAPNKTVEKQKCSVEVIIYYSTINHVFG